MLAQDSVCTQELEAAALELHKRADMAGDSDDASRGEVLSLVGHALEEVERVSRRVDGERVARIRLAQITLRYIQCLRTDQRLPDSDYGDLLAQSQEEV